MLYFSKIKIITVFIVSILLTYLSLSNIFKFDDNFIKNKINLGLDLQGGSYLLLEVDTTSLEKKTIQSKVLPVKKKLKEGSKKKKRKKY